MKIAILGAMPEEIAPLLEKITYKKIDYIGNTFYIAPYKNHELIIAYSKIGKVNSAITSAVMFEKFGAEILLFTGVAGALESELKIGNLLYATKVVQHDLDISAFGHPFGFVPGNQIFVDTDEDLNQKAEEAAKELDVKLIGGIVASGDQFINNQRRKDWIKATFNAAAVEMEGASVGQVCLAFGAPFFMLRAISDEASGGAEFDFDEFMIKSAKISADFIFKMVDKI